MDFEFLIKASRLYPIKKLDLIFGFFNNYKGNKTLQSYQHEIQIEDNYIYLLDQINELPDDLSSNFFDMHDKILKDKKELSEIFKKINKKEDLKVLSENTIFKEIRSSLKHLSGKKRPFLTSNECIVLCTVKNGENFVENFIKHYEEKGSIIFL
ncbi:MAG: hypothetical protein U5L09_12985 [Bacteroidales bacterium]|nr:hypothetical protein [Bacteroidales bacterium]